MRYEGSGASDLEHWGRATQEIQDVENEVLGLTDACMSCVRLPPRRLTASHTKGQ